MEKLISVIIPVYNGEKFIEKCLQKLCNQNYKNIEIIIMNDGSTDTSLKLAENYAKKDERIRVFSIDKNLGASIARINGVKKARGEYVLFHDVDDFYVENTILRLAEVAEKYNTDLIKFRLQSYPEKIGQDIIIKNQPNELVINKNEFPDKIYPLFLNSYSLNSMATLMVKRKKFITDDIDKYKGIRFGEDLILCLELFDNANSVTVITDVLYNYYTNHNSVTKSNSINSVLQNLNDFKYVYSKLYYYLEKWGIDNKDNKRQLDIKVVNEVTLFYNLIRECNDQSFVEANYDKIYKMLYSDLIERAIKNLHEEDLDKNFKYYDLLKEIYTRKINFCKNRR